MTKLILIFIFLISYYDNLSPTIRYVSKTGSSTPPYTSWLTASDSIQKCINICQSGDTVYVANGVYKEKIVMIPGLSLIGSGMDSCIIDTRDMSNKPDFYSITIGDSCLFKYFKVTVAYQSELYGLAAVCFDADALIEWNVFENSSDGIWLTNSNSIIKNCNFINIHTSFRINATNTNNDYKPIIEKNYLSNLGGNAFQVVFDIEPIIRNNIVYLASDYAKGFVGGLTDSTILLNNLFYSDLRPYTILGNSHNVKNIELNNILIADYQREAIWAGNDNVIKNNIIMNGEKAFSISQNPPGQQPIVQFNNIWNNRTASTQVIIDSTNISVNPMFEGEDSLNFYLQMFSPLIDKGDPQILDKDSSRSDIGLYGGPFGIIYEYLDLPPSCPKGIVISSDTNYITIKWNKNTEADFSFYKLFGATIDNFSADSSNLISSLTDTFYVHFIPTGTNKFYYKLSAVDNQGNESNLSVEVGIITSINEPSEIVQQYYLYQNYPNPFNPSTIISYVLKERGYVKLTIYDIKGEIIELLVNDFQERGYHEVEFSASNNRSANTNKLASSIYLYRLDVKSENNIPVFSEMRKMLLVK